MSLTRDRIEDFARRIRELLDQGDVSFRKAYIDSIIDKIEVADGQVRIHGRKDVLEQAVMTASGARPPVRSFVRGWRTRQDSNLRPLPSEQFRHPILNAR